MTSWPRGSNISALRIQSWLARKSSRRSLMVAPLSSGPPPDTSRTGLPQVWPSRQEKVWTDMPACLRRLQEALNLAPAGETDHRLVLAQELNVDGEAMAVAAMGLDRPQQDRLPGEEGAEQRLGVAGAPQILLGDR